MLLKVVEVFSKHTTTTAAHELIRCAKVSQKDTRFLLVSLVQPTLLQAIEGIFCYFIPLNIIASNSIKRSDIFFAVFSDLQRNKRNREKRGNIISKRHQMHGPNNQMRSIHSLVSSVMHWKGFLMHKSKLHYNYYCYHHCHHRIFWLNKLDLIQYSERRKNKLHSIEFPFSWHYSANICLWTEQCVRRFENGSIFFWHFEIYPKKMKWADT